MSNQERSTPADTEDVITLDGPGDDSIGWTMEFANGRSIEVSVYQEGVKGEDPSDLIQVVFSDGPDGTVVLLNGHEAAVIAGYLGLAIRQLIEWGSPLVPEEEPDERPVEIMK